MRYVYFLITLVIWGVSVQTSTFAQNYINPLSFIGRSNDPTLSQRRIDNNRSLNNLLLQGALANQRARQQRNLQSEVTVSYGDSALNT